MANDSVKVQLEVATKAAEQALENFKKKTEDTSKTFEIFKGTLLGGAVLSGVQALGSALGSAFSKSIEEARNAAKENDNLAISLANAGNYSKENMKFFDEYSDSIEMTTLYSGGLVKENLALLQSMTNLDKDGLKRAQDAAIELAAIYNIDLGTATDLVAKAHNGTTTGIAKLGIQFDATASAGEKYSQILQAIEKNAGTAAAKGQTFEGLQARIEAAVNKAYESFGNLIIQNPIVLSAMESFVDVIFGVADGLTSLGEFLKENESLVKAFGVGILAAAVALGTMTAASAISAGAFTALGAAASAAWAAITAPVTLVVAAVAAVSAGVYLLVTHWEQVKAAAYNALAATLEFAARGAAAIGASETAKSLREQAQEYRDQATVIQILAESEKEASDSTTETVIKNKDRKIKAIDEEAQARQKAADQFTKKMADELSSLDVFYKQQQELLAAAHAQELTLEEEFDVNKYEARMTRLNEYFALEQEALDAKLARDLAEIETSKANEETKQAAILAVQNRYSTEQIKLEQQKNKQFSDLQKAANKDRENQNKFALSSTSQLFGALADVAAEGGREYFEIQKAFQIAEALTAGFLAVQNALASGPPPYNFVMAAAVGIQTALNVAKIRNQKAPNFAAGGIVGGNSIAGDQIMAGLNSKEVVLNTGMQQNILRLANGGSLFGNNGIGIELLGVIANAIQGGMTVQIDGREVFNVVREQADMRGV